VLRALHRGTFRLRGAVLDRRHRPRHARHRRRRL
ncbi:MAG: Mannosylglycerate hydrolase @ Glucosylglycerate hydrolase, partial [uncultured Rubrobacteraceae bacterium]